LQSIANELGVWALYITSADLEHKLKSAISGNTVEAMVKLIQYAPFLLLDDYGTEFSSEWVMSRIYQIIDLRYRRPREYPTIVSTNLNRTGLYVLNTRIADRILDNQISFLLEMDGVKSWRSQNNGW